MKAVTQLKRWKTWIGKGLVFLLLVIPIFVLSYAVQQSKAENRFKAGHENGSTLNAIILLYQLDHETDDYPADFRLAYEYNEDVAALNANQRNVRKSFYKQLVNPYTGERVKEVALDGGDAWGDYLYLRFLDGDQVVHGEVFCFLPVVSGWRPGVVRSGHRCGATEGIEAIIGLRPEKFFDVIEHPDDYDIKIDLDGNSFFRFKPEEWRVDESRRAMVKVHPAEES